MKKVFKKPYLYNGQIVLAANAVGQINFQVNSDFNYYMSSFTYRAETAVANTIPYFSIQIQANEDRIFFDWMPSDYFSGMGIETNPAPDLRYPVGLANWFKFDSPYPFPAKSTIVINLRNDTASIITVNFALNGTRVYSIGE